MCSLENLMLREYVGLDAPPPPGISLWLFAAPQSCIWDAALSQQAGLFSQNTAWPKELASAAIWYFSEG